MAIVTRLKTVVLVTGRMPWLRKAKLMEVCRNSTHLAEPEANGLQPGTGEGS